MDTCLSELGTDTHRVHVQHDERPVQRRDEHARSSRCGRRSSATPVQATITPIEQGQYIGLALVGTFNALGWRSHGGIDPDQQRLWWQSASAAPIGGLALNFGRFRDADMDAALEHRSRPTPIPAARKAAAEDVNRIFGEQVYNLWSTWTLWGISSSRT